MNFGTDGGAHSRNRLAGIVFVVVLHIALIYGLVTGLARKAVELLPAPIETRIIEELAPPVDEPPPPTPEFEPPPPPFVPPPDIVIATPPVPTQAITQTTRVKPPPAPPPPPPRRAERIAPRIDLQGSPRACREPSYPSASERLGEQGTSAISLLIGEDGKVRSTRIDASSGHERLDDAAIRAFSRCKFIVGTIDGKPEASWFSIRYKWVVPN